YPGARLIPTGIRQTGEAGSRVLSPDDYVQRSSPQLEKDGFFEREISRRTEKFANIAHLFSTYESRHAKDDAKPFARGINSIQMMNDGKRWWILTIFWQAEDDKNPLPAEYLRNAQARSPSEDPTALRIRAKIDKADPTKYLRVTVWPNPELVID